MPIPEVRFVSEANIKTCLPMIHRRYPEFTAEQAMRWWRAETCRGHHLIAAYSHGHLGAMTGFSVVPQHDGSSILEVDEVLYAPDADAAVLHECLLTYLKVLARAFRCKAVALDAPSHAA